MLCEALSESDLSSTCSEYLPTVDSETESTDEDSAQDFDLNEFIEGIAPLQDIGVNNNLTVLDHSYAVTENEDTAPNSELNQVVDEIAPVQDVGGTNLCLVNDSQATTENQTKRKRENNPEKWKKNVRKKNKAQGKSYTSSTGLLVPEKVFSFVQSCCTKNCYEKFNEDDQKNLFEKFYSMENWSQQNAFVFSQVQVSEVKRRYASTAGEHKKMNTRIFQLPVEGHDTKLCKNLFLKILCISNGRLDRMLKKKVDGTSPRDKRGKHTPANKTSTIKVDEVCSFIDTFPQYESHYTRHKNTRKYLALDMNIKIMYGEYKNKHNECVSENVFRKIFCTKFNLHFHQPITDSCKRCDSLTVQIKHENDEAKKNHLTAMLELHHRQAEKARTQMKTDAEVKDDDTTVFTFDLMKTLPTPVLSTGITYYKRQLWTYCLGVHNLRSGKAIMYVWDESKASWILSSALF